MQGIIHYFSGCCGGDPFGITSGITDNWSSWFDTNTSVSNYISVGSFSGCSTYSGSSLTPVGTFTVYNSTPIVDNLETGCDKCLITYPCYSPPVITPPIIVGYKNECGIITILPMIVECESSNPTYSDSLDGEVSVSITGGTPPYETTWWEYNITSPALNGLSGGTYTATTIDYWKDYTAITVCSIFTEKDCVFSGSIANYIPTPPECYCYIYNFTVESPGYVCWTTCDGENECGLYSSGIEVNDSPCIQGPPGGDASFTIISETVCGNWCDPFAPIPPLPPIPVGNTNHFYTIQITDGVSPGPYTIYYSQVPSTIPPMFPSGLPAENLTLTELQDSIIVEVPIDTGVIYIYNQSCPSNTVVLIVPTITSYSDFCLSVFPKGKYFTSPTSIHFTNNGLDSNNYPIWLGNDSSQSTISWNGTMWVLSTTIYGNNIFSISPLTTLTTYPISWQNTCGGDGCSSIDNITTTEGNCGIIRKQLPPISTNNPTCSDVDDGSIIFNVTLDNPPFNYSIDNGVIYSSSSIFVGLSSGIYSLSVVDSLGETYSSSVTLKKPEQSITYNISLYTTNTTPVINNVSIVNSYETTIVVTPPLPDGTTITFDIIHNNSFYSSPNSGTSILTTSTILYKNNSEVILSNTSNSTNQSINTNAGCQTEYVYQSNIDDIWNSLTISNSDTITISTSSRVDKTILGECVVGYSTDSHSISNPVISGCNCCSIKIN